MIGQLLLGIAQAGYRGPIGPRCLSQLVCQAEDYGLETVLSWIKEDPGLLIMPGCVFPERWMIFQTRR